MTAQLQLSSTPEGIVPSRGVNLEPAAATSPFQELTLSLSC